VTAGDTLTYGGILAGEALVKADDGTLVLAGDNTFGGTVFLPNTFIRGGTLSVSSDANLGSVAPIDH
jgi:autotransporter-associated beta strand protein